MLQKIGIEKNHFHLALIPWVLSIISAPFISVLSTGVLIGVSIIVLIACWIKKGMVYAWKVFLAFIILTVLYLLVALFIGLLSMTWNIVMGRS